MGYQFLRSKESKFSIAAGAVLVSACLLSGGKSGGLEPGPTARPRTVRWVVAHARDDKFFKQPLDRFASTLAKRSAGQLKVEFIDLGTDSSRIAYQLILGGAADMSQISVEKAGVPAIGLPFIFRSYEHAEAVWRGPVGEKLLSEISTASKGKIKGLAFTYSGGYRILAGQSPIRRLSDFQGVRMRNTTNGRVELLQGLGVKSVEIGRDELSVEPVIGLAASGRVDLEETEVNRLAHLQTQFPEIVKRIKYANMTRHSMYVTSVIINDDFFSSLDDRQQRWLREEVEALAAAERRLSVDLAKSNLERLAKGGMSIVYLSQADERRLEKIGESVHKTRYPSLDGLIQEIRGLKETPLQASVTLNAPRPH